MCWPFQIEQRPLVGNVMVASRNISATETILEEAAAIWGPNCKSRSVCLQCLRPQVIPIKKTAEDSMANNTENLAKNPENPTKDPETESLANGSAEEAKPKFTAPKYYCSKCGFPVCDEKCKF